MARNNKIKVSVRTLLILGIAIITACSSSNKSTVSGVGSTGPGGGIVFITFDESDSTGLEVFPESTGSRSWGCEGVVVDAGIGERASNGIGAPSGAESSELLRETNESGICLAQAAELAFGFTNNGFTDWYLPSTDELMMIRDLGFLTGDDGDAYWSSTEDTAENAFAVLIRSISNPLDNGNPSTTDKTNSLNVATIRRF